MGELFRFGGGALVILDLEVLEVLDLHDDLHKNPTAIA